MSERNSLKGVEECFIICLRFPLILALVCVGLRALVWDSGLRMMCFTKLGPQRVLYSIIRPINAAPILREMGKDLKAYEAS